MFDPKIKYIDCHTHLAKRLNDTRCFDDARAASLLRHMKENGIRHSLVYAMYTGSTNDIGNEEIKHIVERCAPYLLGVGSVDINNWGETFASAKRFSFEGVFRAIKLYPTYQQYRLDNPLLDEVYSFCQRHFLPLIIHIGTCRRTKFTVHPQDLEAVLSKYPRLIPVIAHFGIPYMKETVELVSQNIERPIYLDLAGLSLSQKGPSLKDVISYYQKTDLPMERVLFGTDFPLSDAKDAIAQINQLDLSIGDKRKIFFLNSRKLFRISKAVLGKNISKHIKEAWVLPLFDCNSHCEFCCLRGLPRSDRQMSYEEFARVIGKLASENIKELTILGGEPVIWPHLRPAVQMAKRAGMRVSLFTNGKINVPAMAEVDILNLNLNVTSKQVRSELARALTSRGILRGHFTISRHSHPNDIKEALSEIESFSLIQLVLDITETDREEHRNNFDKISGYLQHEKFRMSFPNPFCLLRDDQKLIARTNNNVTIQTCFPSWNGIVIDNDLNLKPCPASNLKRKFDESLSLQDYKNLFSEEIKREVTSLPYDECPDCFEFQSGGCSGGCLFWKDHLLSQSTKPNK